MIFTDGVGNVPFPICVLHRGRNPLFQLQIINGQLLNMNGIREKPIKSIQHSLAFILFVFTCGLNYMFQGFFPG